MTCTRTTGSSSILVSTSSSPQNSNYSQDYKILSYKYLPSQKSTELGVIMEPNLANETKAEVYNRFRREASIFLVLVFHLLFVRMNATTGYKWQSGKTEEAMSSTSVYTSHEHTIHHLWASLLWKQNVLYLIHCHQDFYYLSPKRVFRDPECLLGYTKQTRQPRLWLFRIKQTGEVI
jgi:hypothetical protein